MKNLSTKEIADFFNLEIKGKNKVVDNIGSLLKSNEKSILWAKNEEYLQNIDDCIVVCKSSDYALIEPSDNVTYLLSDSNPRLVFSKIYNQFFLDNINDEFVNNVDKFRKRKDLTIGENVFISPNVEIGEGTVIHHNVVVYPNSKIGKNCVLMANVSVATEGLGLELDPVTDLYVKFPQIGGVILEDYVEIGPNTTIRKSAIDDTIIKRGSKIGALCNIGHNSIIGRNCILSCNVITSGSSELGNNVFMGVSSIIREGINVGNNSIIGQGSVVVKHVPDNQIWVGNPAKKLKDK